MGLNAGAGAASQDAGSIGEAREEAEGWLEGGGDAHPVHNTAQNPFQDVVAQHGTCSRERALHPAVRVGGGSTCRCIGRWGRWVAT
jgi:hypothetical protein